MTAQNVLERDLLNSIIQIKPEPKLYKGGLIVDERSSISFVNEFHFQDVQRFYIIENHRTGMVRAWQAHKYEAKYVNVVKGSALVCAVEIDNWDNPSPGQKVYRYVLSEKSPSVLFIPKGFAHGFMSLSEDTKLIVYSTSSLEESKDDEYTYDAEYWDAWRNGNKSLNNGYK